MRKQIKKPKYVFHDEDLAQFGHLYFGQDEMTEEVWHESDNRETYEDKYDLSSFDDYVRDAT